MIYNGVYRVKFYRNSRTGRSPVKDYIQNLEVKRRSKIYKYICYLRDSGGYLDEPYTRHIQGKVRELRIDFAHSRYRIFYFTFIEKNIILLHVFLKKTNETPNREIAIAINNYNDYINNYNLYEKD